LRGRFQCRRLHLSNARSQLSKKREKQFRIAEENRKKLEQPLIERRTNKTGETGTGVTTAQKDISELAPLHVAALRAVVTSSAFDEINAFIFDVLGRVGLLTRPKSSKAKTDWQLIEQGRTVLARHSEL
jgi:hypothetical protein